MKSSRNIRSCSGTYRTALACGGGHGLLPPTITNQLERALEQFVAGWSALTKPAMSHSAQQIQQKQQILMTVAHLLLSDTAAR